MVSNIIEIIEDNALTIIRLSFVDVSGISYTVSIPARRMETVLKKETRFDSSSIPHFSDIAESDMILMPDPSSFTAVGETGTIICDIVHPDGTPYRKCTRSLLKKALEDQDAEYILKPEMEFFLTKGGSPLDECTYLDSTVELLGHRILDELVLLLEETGIAVEKFHHENGRGQYEVEFSPIHALKAADSILFFKEQARQLCSRHGVEISFLPKPFQDEAGSGMHVHQELRKNGENLFYDGELTAFAKKFIAGQLRHIHGLTRVLNPTANSYQRFLGGKEAPRYICWGHANRSVLVRIPPSGRIEIRSPDPTCNPYLAFFFLLKTGLSGDGELLDPTEDNVYAYDAARLKKENIKELPKSLAEAKKAFITDPLLSEYAYLLG
jgi:glutamine synthetase